MIALALVAALAAGTLDKAFVRATHPSLSDAEFEKKWAGAMVSPVLFIRSYPAAFHKLVAAGPRPPGPEGLCLGDAHPGNFGFLSLAGKTRFAYNDLDDSGYCPIGFDALRYFTALRLFFADEGLFKEVLEQYVDTVKDAGRAAEVDKSHRPDWKKLRAKGIEKTAGQGKLAGEDVSAIPAAEKQAVLAAAAKDAGLRALRILDVAAATHEAGGSGGLKRYWLLAEKGGERTIIELKTAGQPGVEWGRSAKKLSMEQRLPLLKRAFWGNEARGDYFYATLRGARFLVRDRFTKKSLKVEELADKGRRDVLRAQASAMALIHAKAWDGTKKDDLRAWLLAESKAQAAVWRAAYAAAKRK